MSQTVGKAERSYPPDARWNILHQLERKPRSQLQETAVNQKQQIQKWQQGLQDQVNLQALGRLFVVVVFCSSVNLIMGSPAYRHQFLLEMLSESPLNHHEVWAKVTRGSRTVLFLWKNILHRPQIPMDIDSWCWRAVQVAWDDQVTINGQWNKTRESEDPHSASAAAAGYRFL